jgi:hypothetical protein
MEPRHLGVIVRHWPRHADKVVVLQVEDRFVANERELRQMLEPKIRALLARCDGESVSA